MTRSATQAARPREAAEAGSHGFADPHAKIGYAYIPNRMGAHLLDPRDAALRRAMYRSIGEGGSYRG